MGGSAVLLHVSPRRVNWGTTIGILVRRVRFLGLVGGFGGLLYRKPDYSGQTSRRGSMSLRGVTECTAVATVSHEVPDRTV